MNTPRDRTASFYYLAASLLNERERDTREITSRTQQRKNYDPLLSLSETEFISRFRLSKAGFCFLCNELRKKGNLTSSKRIKLEEKVLCALSFFATGSYQRIGGEARHFGQRTVSKIIEDVTNALNRPEMLNKYIQFPETTSQREHVKSGFYANHGIHGVIGAIDGSHFHIFKPPYYREHHLYYNRKHFHSLNVQMICDSEGRILNINAKYGGATHDAFIWENSGVNKLLQDLHNNNEMVWLLGDSGYPQRPWLMTPIQDAVDGTDEALFNQIHAKARVSIENTFGRLKNRWRCLSKDRTLHYAPEKCAKIIMSCAVLHNLVLKFKIPDVCSLPESALAEVALRPAEADVAMERHEDGGDYGDDLIRGRAIRSLVVQRLAALHRT